MGLVRLMAPSKPADGFGPYRIVRQIGSGGMASIFEAIDTRLGHRVAIKCLHPHVAQRPGASERFLREGRAAARVRHPHVVQVFALGAEGESAYLAMELLEGCDLGAALAQQGRLGVEDTLELLLPVTAAIAAAHEVGVIHRDLKPSNVFVSRGAGGRRWPKVLDFGISKVLESEAAASVTGTDAIMGTAAYMAPEQARAVRAASFLSDQYSLAVILYECLTGKLPFSGSSIYDLVSAIMTAPVVSPAQRVEGIPPALDSIVLRAMSRNPGDRFPSVRVFGESLLPFARARDRSAWSVELRSDPAEPASRSAAPAEPLDRMAVDGPAAATPATMAPTVHDTRVLGARTRVVRRAMMGVVAAGALIAASASAWILARRGDALPGTNARATRSIPPSDPTAPSLPGAWVSPPPGMAAIDAGTMTVGRSRKEVERQCAEIGATCDAERLRRLSWQVPEARVKVAPFYLDVHEATNAEMVSVLNALRASLTVVEDDDYHFRRYVRFNSGLGHDGELLLDLYPSTSGIEYTGPSVEEGYRVRPGRERWPVTQVTWFGARLFCVTEGKRLPKENEWEAAARGAANRTFPWGEAPVRCGAVAVPFDGLTPSDSACQTPSTPRDVGQAPQDVTPEGIHDLAGNVAEWTETAFAEGEGNADGGSQDVLRVIRGGSYAASLMARTSTRTRQPPNSEAPNTGFRCAASVDSGSRN